MKDKQMKLNTENKIKKKKDKFDKNQFLKDYDLVNLNQSELTALLSKDLNKEQLLLIAEIKFGIPRGSNLRRSKEQVLQLIKDAINHKKLLEVIKERASE